MRWLAASACLAALISFQREKREVRPSPTRLAVYGDAAPESDLHPGGSPLPAPAANPYKGEAYDISVKMERPTT